MAAIIICVISHIKNNWNINNKYRFKDCSNSSGFIPGVHTKHSWSFAAWCFRCKASSKWHLSYEKNNIIHCAGAEGDTEISALMCSCSGVYKVTFPACSVMLDSLMAVWCRLKSGCCSFCWVIWKIVWWKDIWEGGRKIGTLTLYLSHTCTFTPVYSPPLCISYRTQPLAPFTELLVYDQSQLKNKTCKKSALRETFSKVFEEHEVPNKV